MEISKREKYWAKEYREMGWTYRKIARALQMSHVTVWRFLNKKSIWTRILDFIKSAFPFGKE